MASCGFSLVLAMEVATRGGRPKVPLEIRQLIRDMSLANPLWGAPRIHGELLKLGIEIGQTSVAKYMARHEETPIPRVEDVPPQPRRWDRIDGSVCRSDTLLSAALWLADPMARPAPDLMAGRDGTPSAEWMARQLTEACGWEWTPSYIVRDRDRVYGEIFTRRLRAMGIRDRPTAPHSPWQNGHTERLIGSIRRECLDHVVVFGERHLRHVLLLYMDYYNNARTHLSLNKDAPVPRAAQVAGAFFRHQFSADCTISMFGFDFRQGHRACGSRRPSMPAPTEPSPEAGMNIMRKAVAKNDLAKLKNRRTRITRPGRSK